MNIVVLAGGLSPEREVSLTSGTLIANALIENGHRVLLLDVYLGMRALPAQPLTLFSDQPYPAHTVSERVPDLDALRRESQNGDALIGANVLALCAMADRVFLALHGSMGENGQLQATLETHGIRYTGSDYAGSLLAMDKDIAKRLFCVAGIPTPEWVYFSASEQPPRALWDRVGLPCVVKPCDCGSSVGISMADTEEERSAALAEAARWGSSVLVEKKIVGRELTVGVLDGTALPAVEILPESGFYDYKNKYQGTTREICPAEIPDAVAARAADLALRGFAALRLSGYARFDFLLDQSGELWCLEANTLPGMTPTSLLPLAASVAGISYRDLCERIINL
ncbi:MAG: D-alanine--D-alanine ligase [Ruminococcaceae bacterium]|nr:D-alanine--D-alanine ligase [Oscillospiraceae bacterium]